MYIRKRCSHDISDKMMFTSLLYRMPLSIASWALCIIVCRALTFLKKSFDSTIPLMDLGPEDEQLVAMVTKELRAFNEGLDKMK